MLQSSNSKPGKSESLNQQPTSWFSTKTKAVLVGVTGVVSGIGIGYLLVPHSSSECSLPGGFWCTQPSNPQPIDYTSLSIGGVIMGIFTTAICYLTGACTNDKEEKLPLPAKPNNSKKLSFEEKKTFEKHENDIELASMSSKKDLNESSPKMDEQEIKSINEMLKSLSTMFSDGINWKTDPIGERLLEELNTHDKDLLEICNQVIPYLKKLEYPLNHTEKSIIQTLTVLMKKKISDSSGSMETDFFLKLESVFFILLRLDPNSAVAIARTCFDVSKECSVRGECKKMFEIALRFPDISKMLARECAKSMDHSEGNVKSTLVYFLKEMNWNEPALTEFLKECAKRDDEYLLELIINELDDVLEIIKTYNPKQVTVNKGVYVNKWKRSTPTIQHAVSIFIKQDKYTAALALLKKCVLNGICTRSIVKNSYNILRSKSIETANELANYYEEVTGKKLKISSSEETENLIKAKEKEICRVEQNKISKKQLLCTFELHNEIISYLKAQELPLNDHQRSLVQSLVASIETLATYQMSTNEPNPNNNVKKDFYKILEEAFHLLYRIDKDSAFNLWVAKINGSENGIVCFPWGFLESDDVKQWLISNSIKKCEDYSITKNECQAVVNYLRSVSFPNYDVSLKPLIKALANFIVEKIRYPAKSDPLEKDLPSMIKSVFDLLLYHTEDRNLVFEIAVSCVNVASDAPENLKTQCHSIVKTILQHNKSIAYDLIRYCVKQIDGLNPEETTNRLTWFLEAEKHRILHSLSNHLRKQMDTIYNRFSDETYTINTSLYLRSFLNEAAKIDDEVLQKCLLEAFKVIIKQELSEFHNWNSAVIECVVEFLMRDSVENYDLALSLLKLYMSSTANGMRPFIKGAYEELFIKSPKTANQLAKYFEEINDEELIKYVEHSINYWSSQDGTSKSHKEIEENGIQQLCCKHGSMPHPRHFIKAY